MKQVYPTTIESGMSQSGSCVLMLGQPETGVQVPVIIGQHEAQSILLARNKTATNRPTTHQLMVSILDTFGLTVEKVTIDKLVDGVFYSTLYITDGFNQHTADSRTTDAITLALLHDAPIFIADNVLHEAGTRHESALQPNQPTIEELEAMLHTCEENEEYERAAELQAQIEQLKQSNKL